jgi:DNA-binding NtrC family response regulator
MLCHVSYTLPVVHILLVDDNETFLYTGRELLLRQRPTFVVDTVLDAEKALFAIRTQDYDVVVSDIRLPRLDGIALLHECQHIRPDTPVVLISGYGDMELEEKAARCGAYAFLHKPIDADTFFSVVYRAVLRAQLRRRPEQVLGQDSVWYPQAVEQLRRRSGDIALRLEQAIHDDKPTMKRRSSRSDL